MGGGGHSHFQTAANATSVSSFFRVRLPESLGLRICVEGPPCSPFIEFVLSNEGVNYGLLKIMLWALPHEESRTEK